VGRPLVLLLMVLAMWTFSGGVHCVEMEFSGSGAAPH